MHQSGFPLSKQLNTTPLDEGQKTYFSEGYMSLTQEVLVILDSCSFGILICKAIYGSILDILGCQWGNVITILRILTLASFGSC